MYRSRSFRETSLIAEGLPQGCRQTWDAGVDETIYRRLDAQLPISATAIGIQARNCTLERLGRRCAELSRAARASSRCSMTPRPKNPTS